MFTAKEVNSLMDFYISENTTLSKNKIFLLEDFRSTEDELKNYIEALNELEKQQNQVNLSEFRQLKEKTIEVLSQFDPKNMESNIFNVMETVNFFQQIENDLVEVSGSLVNYKKIWKSFIKRNPEYEDSIFSKHIGETYDKLRIMIESVVPQDIGVLSSDIDSERMRTEKIIFYVEKIKNFLNLHIFVGESNLLIKKRIELLLTNLDNKSVGDFIDEAKDILSEVEKIKEYSTKGRVAVEVVKGYNISDSSIYKYTVVFGDHVVKYDSFFKSKGMKFKKTGQFIFLEDYPIEGIFSGKEIVKDLMFDNDYLIAVETLVSKANFNFAMLGTFIVITAIIAAVIGGIGTVIQGSLSLALLFGFRYYLFNLKSRISKKYSLKNFFTFSMINFFFVKEGEDIEVKEILMGIIRDFDDTVLNIDFQKEVLTKYGQ